MTSRHFITGLYLIALAAGAGQAAAQNYPVKTVRLVSAAAGAGSDFVARTLSTGLAESWGQTVTVDNRGGSAVIPIEVAAKAPPDGYTFLVFGSALWHLPFMQSVSYDPVRDFAPVILAATTPLVVLVHPSLPVKSVKELIAFAKARPGQLNYSSGIAGSTTHLPVELFKAMTGVDLVRVSYKGGAPALIALLSGETQVMIANANNIASMVSSGKFRALAVTTAQRSALLPNLPTVAEAGVPGYEASSVQCLLAPAGVPAAIINRVNRDAAAVLSRPEVKARFFKGGVEFVPNTPEALAAFIKSDMAAMGKVIKAAGIRGD